jgi:1-acyl-sn-glycerol-3-phosphate acyltransferase
MVRLLKLIAMLAACDLHLLLSMRADLRTRAHRRSVWSRRTLRALGITLTVHGEPPQSGMIVGNHLSYLDILTYGAVMEGVFVSKEEVRHWPLIGLATRLAGTIYINRRSRTALAPVNDAAAAVLRSGIPVTFFPEGTSSDGTTVLRFHPGLFQAAVETGAPIWPAAMIYRIDGSSEGVAEEVCYWGAMRFTPHVLRFLRLRNVSAELRFAAEPIRAANRVQAASLAQAAVAQLAGLPIASKEASAAILHTAMQSESL